MTTTTPSMGRGLLLFTLAQAMVTALLAVGLSRLVWTDPAAVHAVQVGALLAVGVQVLTFAIARLVARQQVIAGWGIGVLLRFAVVAGWAFLGIPALGLVPGPALLSLVAFFFGSTLLEPLFLNV
jgi:hypothetical protein